MSVDLDRLSALMPAPGITIAKPPWEQARAEIGFDFPSDYRAFVARYGAGTFGPESQPDYNSVFAPCCVPARPGDLTGFRAFAEWTVAEVRPAFIYDGAEDEEWDYPHYPVYPDSGGLLAWGDNHGGDLFCWLTQGPDPDRWPVVMYARHPDTMYAFGGGMVAFLLALFSGDHPASVLGWPGVGWTTRADWSHRGLSVSSGPAAA